MVGQTSADIFKFMTLRSPQNQEHEKDLVAFIRDNRIPISYLPAESHDVVRDAENFSQCSVGQILFGLIQKKIPADPGVHVDTRRLIRFLNIERSKNLNIEPNKKTSCLTADVFRLLLRLWRWRWRWRWLRGPSVTGCTSMVAGDASSPSPTEEKPCTRCAEEKLTGNGSSPVCQVAINTQEDWAEIFMASPLIHKIFAYLTGYYRPFNDLRPVGIGDLLVVKQFLCRYEAGEIAHVENVLRL